MSSHVFCDESKARGFVLVASYVPCREVTRLREAVDALTLRRQVRIHFRREDDPRKEKILAALIDAKCTETVVYDARRHSHKDGRDLAIAAMADDAAAARAQRIVVETDHSVVANDKLIIAARLALADREELTSSDHMLASEEGLLAVPDAVAWCYAKGGVWGKRAQPLIKRVVIL